MRRFTALVVAVGLALGTPPAEAFFHDAVIDEIMAGTSGNPNVQFVEIRMLSSGQRFVNSTVLTAFNCDGSVVTDLLTVPGNVPNSGSGTRWIMASPDATTFLGAAGIDPDFQFSGTIAAPCGQICWGANSGSPPHGTPNDHVDCVAYGNYTGPTRAGALPAAADSPGGGTYSLTRGATAFTLACPTPTNNDGESGGFGACTPPGGGTTTTTLGGGTTTTATGPPTTTTTLPPATSTDLLAGKRLALRARPGKPSKSSALLVAKDPGITLGGGNGSADDPTLHRASLRLQSSATGAFFDGTYPLAGSWKVLGKTGADKGYRWKSKTSPVRAVVVRAGKRITVAARGADLILDLAGDPVPVGVVLQLGTHRYCLRFGGTTKAVPGKRFDARGAPAPGDCPGD